MDITTTSGRTVTREDVNRSKTFLNCTFRFIPIHQRQDPKARVVWCFEAIQRQLAATFVQMLRSGILRKLDRIAKSPGHPDANVANSFLSSNRWRDDNDFFTTLVKVHPNVLKN